MNRVSQASRKVKTQGLFCAAALAATAGTYNPAYADGAAGDRCQLSQVLLVVDRSSSMVRYELPDGATGWEALSAAVGTFADSYASRAEIGVQTFPSPNRCGAGTVVLPMGRNTPESIKTSIGTTPPWSNNFTPISGTLDAARDYLASVDSSRPRHLFLITDGFQYCGDDDSASFRTEMIESVRDLTMDGIIVHIMGLGGSVDSRTLNSAATVAGTAIPGCDPTHSSARHDDQCYLQADDTAEIEEALADFGDTVSEEICNSLDDDCDGRIDEGFDADGDGVAECEDCDDTDASVAPGVVEECDGIDNDCDAVIDPACECDNGQTEACGPAAVGICTPGSRVCVNNHWGDCVPGTGPDAEVCNGLDDDCDATIDEGSSVDCTGEFELCLDGRCQAPGGPGPGEPTPRPAAPDESTPRSASEPVDAAGNTPLPRPSGGGGCSASVTDVSPTFLILGLFGTVATRLQRRRRNHGRN